MTGTVLVVAEQRSGQLNPASLETLVAGQRTAKGQGKSLVVALVGAQMEAAAEQLAGYQMDRLLVVEDALLDPYSPGVYCSVVEGLVREISPDLVFFPHTYQGRDFAPRVAARCGRSLISDCVDIRNDAGQLVCVREIFQGKLHADVVPVGEPPHFASFQSAAFSIDELAAAATACQVEKPAIAPDASAPGVVMAQPVQEGERSVDLSQAEIVVSVGRGIGDAANIDIVRQLADAIGGEVGASRPVCDEGWLPIERQVGSSGQTVAPKLYIALGISGASQHLVGMKGSKLVVAVNKDPKAPIFKQADYGITGDVMEVIPALIKALGA
jgi:electron transfer flavoprotein alpha subunit